MKMLLIAAACLLALTNVPTGLAQAAPDAGMGQLVFTDVVTKTTNSANAGDIIFYGMTPGAPGGTASKVYFPRTVFAVGWTDSFAFEWIADHAFTLTGKAIVEVQVGCDTPVVFRPAADSPAANPRPFSFDLWKGTATIASTGWTPAAPACTPGTLIAGEIEIDTKETEVGEGDLLRIGVSTWSSNFFGGSDPARSLFILVGDAATPSRVMAAGLPVPGPSAPAAEAFAIAAATDSASAAPGESAAYSLIVENSGASNASFELAAVGLPEGFEAVFEPQSGTAAPGSATMANLTVTVPAGAEPQTHAFSVQVQGPNGGNATVPLNLEVVKAGTSPSKPTGPTGSTGTSSPTSTGSAGNNSNATDDGAASAKETETGGDTPGPSLVLAAVSLAGASWLARRRKA